MTIERQAFYDTVNDFMAGHGAWAEDESLDKLYDALATLTDDRSNASERACPCPECKKPLTMFENGSGSCDNGCEMHFQKADLIRSNASEPMVEEPVVSDEDAIVEAVRGAISGLSRVEERRIREALTAMQKVSPTVRAAIDDHERIWLQPKCCVDLDGNRLWCQDNVWPDTDDCKQTGVEYVRADLAR